MNPNEWIEEIFEHGNLLKISTISDIKSDVGKPCIMSDPKITMDNPYLGDHLPKCLDMVDDALKRSPSNRFKPVVVTLRGSGCGKTRLLEEIRRSKNKDRKNKDRNNIVLSITFNNLTNYFAEKENFTSVGITHCIYLHISIVYVTQYCT